MLGARVRLIPEAVRGVDTVVGLYGRIESIHGFYTRMPFGIKMELNGQVLAFSREEFTIISIKAYVCE